MWNYPVVLHKDTSSDYGVTVPDLPGCFSAGRTLDEALAMAREAIELHLEGLLEDGQPLPDPGDLEQHQSDPAYTGGTWAVVAIESAHLRLRSQRLSITMPQRLVESVDRYASGHGMSRSALLTRAATAYIDRADDPAQRAKPPGKPSKQSKPARKTRPRS